MAIGHVQERNIAKFGYVIEAICGCGSICIGVGAHAQPRHGASAHDLHKFTFREVHSFALTNI